MAVEYAAPTETMNLSSKTAKKLDPQSPRWTGGAALPISLALPIITVFGRLELEG